MVFAGFRTPSIKAQIREKKPDGTLENPLQVVGEISIGRTDCDVVFPDDVILSDHHASLWNREGKLILKDLGSRNGTYVKQRRDRELVPGDIFLLGRELFRFTTQSMDKAGLAAATQEGTMACTASPMLQRGPLTAKLEHIKLTGEVIEEFSLEKPETTLGRTNGDLVFKNNPYMSGTHARIMAQPERFILQDLKSRNGVFCRVRDEVELTDGDEFFLGEHLFRVEIKQGN